ncbi:(Fe-S)-binding protein [Chloroflexota bacterium]
MFDLPSVINDTRIRLCLDCGKCTVVCPIVRYDPEFNPRLIVQAALGQNGCGPVDEKIWSCLSCNMCMERCNYNVKFTDFIRFLRYRALAEDSEVQYSHGEIPQSIMHIMAHRDIKQNRLNWLPEDIKIHKQSDTAFFVGCAPYFDILFSDLDVKTAEGSKGALMLLNRAQIPFTLLSNERCCGRDLLLMGDTEGFLALAQANEYEFNRRGIKNIITSCPECYYTLKVDYPKFLKNWGFSVKHITEIISPLVESGQLALRGLKQKVTYHDPCTLGRYSRMFDQPRHILNSVENLEVVEMADNREKALCCGASPWVHCGLVNKQIQKERLAQAGATGANKLVTACPKCQIHLKCAQKNAENNDVGQIEIQDLFDFAAQSLLPQEEVS